jgi:hypothetical protein
MSPTSAAWNVPHLKKLTKLWQIDGFHR